MATVFRGPLVRGKALVLLAAAALAFALVATLQAAAYHAYTDSPIPWIGLFKAQLVNGLLYAAFVPVLFRLAVIRPITRESWPAALPLHLLAGTVAAVFKEVLFTIIGNLFRPGVFHLGEILAGDYFKEILFFWAVSAGVHAYIAWAAPQAKPEADGREEAVDRFLVSGSHGYRAVASDEIEWIGAQGNYAQLNTAQGSYLVRETMASLERRLGDEFVRVHRGTIVNKRHIQRIEPRSHGSYAILVSSGEQIVTSRSYNARLRSLLN